MVYYFTIGCSKNKMDTPQKKHSNDTVLVKFNSNGFDYELNDSSLYEFYFNRLDYELKHNTLSIHADSLKNLLLSNYNMLINVKLIGKYRFYKSDVVLKVVDMPRGIERAYLFYKYYFHSTSSIYNPILHIEYPLQSDGRKKICIYILKNDSLQTDGNAAYIQWSSKAVNLEEGNLIQHRIPIYTWGINTTTDTVITNLSIKDIKILYPNFSGVFIRKQYKELILNYKYSTSNGEFFNNIVLK